jgi:HEAT repeat protein
MQPNNPEAGSGKGPRPAVILTTLAVAALVALAAVLLFRHKSTPQPGTTPVSTVGDTTAQSATTLAPESTHAAVSTADTNTEKVASPGAVAQVQMSVSDLIKILNDPSLPLEERKKAIKALALDGSAEAIGALKNALAGGTDELRVAIAEGLGACASLDCTLALQGLLNDSNAAVVKAALRGLAQQGSPQGIAALTQLLYDSQRSADIRQAAIQALGAIHQPGALDALTQAALNLNDEGFVSEILTTLGSRDFSETQGFFQNYLRSPTVPSDLRVAAVEALAQAQGDPTAFLLSMVSDQNPDVRNAAAWALSATDATGSAGPQLLGLLQAESDPGVRARLYQALGNQESYDTASVLNSVQQEKDPAAQAAGLDLLAKTLAENPSTPGLQSFFDQTAIPLLRQIALSGPTSDERMTAIIALTRLAGTQPALQALQYVAQNATDPNVLRAAGNIANNPPHILPRLGK